MCRGEEPCFRKFWESQGQSLALQLAEECGGVDTCVQACRAHTGQSPDPAPGLWPASLAYLSSLSPPPHLWSSGKLLEAERTGSLGSERIPFY